MAVNSPRFLAFIGEGSLTNAAGHVVQSDLGLTFAAPGLRVAYAGTSVPLGDRGILIGHLFRRGLPSLRVLNLSTAEIDRILWSDGGALLQEFWGGYVAFLRRSDGSVRFVREPSGTIPAYWRETREGIVIASELGRTPFAPADGLRIDTDALAVHLWAPHFTGHRTCISGVSEILPGEAFDIVGRNQRSTLLWSPWDHVPANPRDVQADPSLLRDTILDAVTAWGDCFSNVLLGLSGGLDSSIVAAALRSSTCRVAGFTMYGADGESDERSYARQAASAASVSLACVDYDQEALDLSLPIASHVARPFLGHYAQAIANVHERAARDWGVDAYFSGNGGDNVFFMMHSVTPIVDRINARARPSMILKTIDDVAAVTGADWLTVLRHLVRRYLRGQRHRPPQGDDALLDGGRLAAAIENVTPHPWFEVPGNVSVGAAAHVAMLRRALGNDGLHSRATHSPSISPLLSQPVVELCLGFPSWLWVEGGMDRSIARQAFRDVLPTALLNRRSKGGPSGFVHRVYQRHEAQVLEHLRNGPLLQSEAIRLPEHSHAGTRVYQPQRLLALTAADAWMRYWNDR
jgi:asparagine synthase (glutamine-hydrolysing)